MKTSIQLVLFLLIGCYFSSCRIQRAMTKEELGLIEQFDENTPFRVLQVTDPDELKILRTKSKDIPFGYEPSIRRLISRLKITLQEEQGVGIAAPQVGINRNVFLFVRVDKPGQPVEVAINPRIVNHPKETVCFERDGCLSIPGISGNSVRYPWIDVEYINEQGKSIKERLEGYSRLDNFVAVIFQHEYDHLQGVLFTDKLCPPDTIASAD